jgi:type II secretory pathway pseudopilin PulG
MELLVVLSLIGILTTGVLSLFSAAIQQWSRGSGKSESDDVASLAIQKIVRLIESGKSATASNNILGPGVSVLMPTLNDQGDYDRTGNGNTIRVYLSNSKVYYTVNAGTAVQIATGVTSFSYSISGGSVTLSLTISRQSGTKTSQTTFTQRVALRNYTTPI